MITLVNKKGVFYHMSLEAGERPLALAPVQMEGDIRKLHDGENYVCTVIEPLERKVISF